MKISHIFNLPLCISIAILFLGACAKDNKDGEFVGVDGDYVTGTPLPERQEGVSFFGGGVDRNTFAPVYFPFDSFGIASSEEGKLQTLADALRGNSSTVIIAGFTDERGTEEYNRVLGERRALAVRDALIQRGVSGARLQTVSFGQELPADPGSNESAWARNRRAEFGLVQ